MKRSFKAKAFTTLIFAILVLNVTSAFFPIADIKIPRAQAASISPGQPMQDHFDYEFILEDAGNRDPAEGYQDAKFMEATIYNLLALGCQFKVNSTNPINGTDSVRMVINGTHASQNTYAWSSVRNSPDPYYVPFPGTLNPFHERVWFRLDNWTVTHPAFQIGLLVIFEKLSFTNLLAVGLQGPDAHLIMMKRNSTGYHEIDSSTNVTLGQTYSLEIRRYQHATSGDSQCWLDGVIVDEFNFQNDNTSLGYEQTGIGLGNRMGVGYDYHYAEVTFDDFKVANATIGTVDSLSSYTLSVALQNVTDSSMLNGSVRLGMHDLGYTDSDWINLTVPEGTMPKFGVPTSINGVPFLKFEVNGSSAYDEIYPLSWGMNCTVTRGQPEENNWATDPIYGDTQYIAFYGESEPPPESNYELDCGFEGLNYTTELGSARWNGTHLKPGCALEYSSPPAHHGVNSSKAFIETQNGPNYAYAYRDWGAAGVNELWLRTYLNYTSLPAEGGNNFEVAIYSTANTPVGSYFAGYANFHVHNDSGTPEWKLQYWNETNNYVITQSWPGFSLNTWYCVELHYNVSDTAGAVELWIGDALNYSKYGMDTDFSARKIRYACVGAYQSDWNNGYTCYADCVVGNSTLSTDRIGPEEEEGPGPSNTVTLNAPSDLSTLYVLNVNFNYTPSFSDPILNSSLWANATGTWQRLQWNTTTITNGSLNTLSYTFGAYATYIWNVEVFNSTTGVFASSNWTVTLQEISANSVTLNAPSDDSTLYVLNVNFNYTPSFSDPILNSSLWANVTGTWQRLQWNTTVVTNASLNTISYTFGAYATYIWNIEVFNSSQGVFASSNWTVTLQEPSANFVTLNLPADDSTTSNLAVTFTYTPSFSDVIMNASLWANVTGTWQRLQWNTTAITNASQNTISYTFGAYATYIWNIQVFNSSQGVFAVINWTLTIVETIPKYYYTFGFQDLDANNVKNRISWTLWNDTQQLSYTEGQLTLINGTYTLNATYRLHLINQTTLQTWVTGNSTVTIGLQMKKQLTLTRWIAFNSTIGSITVNVANDNQLTFTVTGSGTFLMVVDVPRNCSYVSRAGVNQTGWTYTTTPVRHVYLITNSLSTWVYYYAPAGSPGGDGSDTSQWIHIVLPYAYIGIGIWSLAWIFIIGFLIIQGDSDATAWAVILGVASTIALIAMMFVLQGFSTL